MCDENAFHKHMSDSLLGRCTLKLCVFHDPGHSWKQMNAKQKLHASKSK